MDPLEIDESNYHTGLAFKVFSENLKELLLVAIIKFLTKTVLVFLVMLRT